MTWPQRIEHIWLNYSIQIGLVIGICILLISVLVSIHQNDTNLLASGEIINVSLTEEGNAYIGKGFFSHIQGNEAQKDEVRVSSLSFADMNNTSEIDYNYGIAQGIVSRVHVQSVDYYIMNEYAMKFTMTQELLLDLRQFFTEEELAAFEEKGLLIKGMREDATEPVPVAVIISDTAFAKKCITAPSKVYFSVASTSPRLEICRTFWDYLMAFEE